MMKNTKKKVMALATAGLIVFSATTAFANEGSDDLGLEVITETNTNDKTNLENTTNEEIEVVTEEPAVLPGSIFYFVKTAFEKIRLALTFEDAKEAKLLATYAKERLEEAEALFKDGQEDKALQTIYDALTNLENAESMVDEEKTEEEAADTTEPVIEENQDTKESTTEEKDDENEETNSTESEKSSEVEKLDEVEKLISQNIIALTTALEKVKNPAAKVALQRNIEKSYAKLALKMEKLAEKKKEREAKIDFVPVEVKAENNAKVETQEKAKAEIKVKAEAKAKAVAEAKTKSEVRTKKESSVVVEAPKAQTWKNKQSEAKQKIKDMKNEHKSNVQQIKNEIKEVKKDVKQKVNIGNKVEKIESKLEKHIPVKIEKKDFDNKGSYHQENQWNHQGR
ncbi:DUF5667 domain-containing protein [Bacillaceae bacterium CLA-AA-H227]|uniref:DUF5667 domain-containing protein n=1 Tax=Robertmurraya yapensis (ex Hitch et al 2024) TaxID=3133160 RepID=A0ACC6S815_9BACI